MKHVTSRFLLVFASVSLLWGCSTKVELNAEWKDTTIVFGLLDVNDNYHFMRINKAYLGEGNAYNMALIADSSEYQNVSAVIKEKAGSFYTGRTWTLQDTLMTDRDSNGIFYNPNYKLYYFVEPTLDFTKEYELTVTVGDQNGKEVTAVTEMVQPVGVNPPITFGFAGSAIGNNVYYQPNIKWTTTNSAVRYEVILRLKYDEYTASGVTRRVLEWNQGSFDPGSLSGSATQFVHPVSGLGFYQYMASVIPDDANVISRRFRAIDMVVYAASRDLDTYINVNAPSTGLIQERPSYTNVVNGLGLFSSRVHVVAANKYISEFSMQELCEGQYTKIQRDLKFCTDSSVYASKSYYCP